MSEIVKTFGALDGNYSKENLVQRAKQHAIEILENEQLDLLRVYVEFKRYETYLVTLIGEVKEASLDEAQKEGKRRFYHSGAELTVQNTRKYNYEEDPHWAEVNETMERLKILKKRREEVLKNLDGVSKEILNPDTGELEFVKAPSTITKPTLYVRL